MTTLDPAVAIPKLEEFLKTMAKAGRLDLRFKVSAATPKTEHDPQLRVECDGQDVDILLGRGGELLDAIEHLAAKVLRLHSDEQSLIVFDSHNFRSDRALELRLMAEAAVTKPRAHWMAELEANDVPFAPVNRIHEVIDDPQVKHLETFTTFKHPTEGDKIGRAHV